MLSGSLLLLLLSTRMSRDLFFTRIVSSMIPSLFCNSSVVATSPLLYWKKLYKLGTRFPSAGREREREREDLQKKQCGLCCYVVMEEADVEVVLGLFQPILSLLLLLCLLGLASAVAVVEEFKEE